MAKKSKEKLWWYGLDTTKMTKDDLNFELLKIFNSIKDILGSKQRKTYLVNKLKKDKNKKEVAELIKDFLPDSYINNSLIYLEMMLEHEVIFNDYLNNKLETLWNEIIAISKNYYDRGEMCESTTSKDKKPNKEKEKVEKKKEVSATKKEKKSVEKKKEPIIKKEKKTSTTKKSTTPTKKRSRGWV